MARYKQLKSKNKVTQNLLTEYHNKLVYALDHNENSGIILITNALDTPRVITNIKPDNKIPSIISTISKGLNEQIKKD